jgi:hypothetical protein
MRQTEETTSRMMRKFGIRFSVHHPRAEEVRRGMIAVASHADWNALLEREYAG